MSGGSIANKINEKLKINKVYDKNHKPLSITKRGVNKNLKKIQSKNYKNNFYN